MMERNAKVKRKQQERRDARVMNTFSCEAILEVEILYVMMLIMRFKLCYDNEKRRK